VLPPPCSLNTDGITKKVLITPRLETGYPAVESEKIDSAMKYLSLLKIEPPHELKKL